MHEKSKKEMEQKIKNIKQSASEQRDQILQSEGQKRKILQDYMAK